ncbi:hypothetical protein BKP35_18315 [Anaerobacillus arseniciselenatis]|uniref:Single-stranded DNA-binding protein n=1 Tax=Anaerobacillus arseniciselenatis TaxID=85682 RepID=A0A1S2L5R1_9BACI|nr:hypothetical protein BKP35_18315 [Anaerobacillus arseniciselenatis]
MINRVILTGRLTKAPGLKYTPTGKAVANFTLAVNRTYVNGDGERGADFINCILWGKQAENAVKYLHKGSLCGVDGTLRTRKYENNDGNTIYVVEVNVERVQFLEKKKDQYDEQY